MRRMVIGTRWQGLPLFYAFYRRPSGSCSGYSSLTATAQPALEIFTSYSGTRRYQLMCVLTLLVDGLAFD